MKKAIAIFLALALAACSKDEVPIVTVVEAEPVPLPAECTSADPPWVKLPDADVTRSTSVKNYDANKRQYSRVLARRAVCRAAIQSTSKG